MCGPRVPQLISRDSLVTLRERHVATTTAPGSVSEHFVTQLLWAPNQQQLATLSASPRVKLWRVDAALKGGADGVGTEFNNGECTASLHGHLR